MDMKNVVKILLRLHEQGFSKEVIFFYCFDGKYETAKRRVMAKISHFQNEGLTREYPATPKVILKRVATWLRRPKQHIKTR